MAHPRNSSGDGKQVLNLPFGYRFYPTNDQVIHYLKQKILGGELPADIIPTIDVYSHNPDQLPLDKFKYGVAGEWFFFTHRLAGDLPTTDGYWSPAGLPAEIGLDNRIIGFKQVVDFYWGHSPNGTKSNWTMYEYRLNPDQLDGKVDETTQAKVQNFVACRARNKDKFQPTATGGAIQERIGSLPTNELEFLSSAVMDGGANELAIMPDGKETAPLISAHRIL
nr:NAC domain-containing protein 41-like [Coffea arabica]